MALIKEIALVGRQAAGALRRDWMRLVGYQFAVSLLTATPIGPLALALSYELIGLGDEGALANSELAAFLLSPLGGLAFALVASLAIGRIFIEYSGLIILADAALERSTLSTWQLIARVLAAVPRLLALAAIQTSLAVVVTLPFLAVAALTYWLLLSDVDINYYLSQRPPRFWLAVAVGVVLAVGWLVCLVWFFVRWALAVPACVLDGQGWLAALRTSARRMRGRARRMLLIFVGWQLLELTGLFVALALLDQLNHALFAGFEDRLSLLVWSTVSLLLIDAAVVQLLGALFAIGRAILLAREYEQARRSGAETDDAAESGRWAPSVPSRPTWRARGAVVALVVVGPAASLLYALFLEREWVEHRPARVTGHRAGSKAAVENSLAALRESIAIGADFVEIDVQQTADGQVVLLHDRDLRRVTGDVRELHAVTLADLADLRLRDERGPTGERIPTFSEFIAACDGRIRINIELKDFGYSSALAPAVVDVLRERGFTDRAIISSFEMEPLRQIREAAPEVPIGRILSAVQGDPARLPVDFLSLHQRLVTANLVRRAHRAGKQVHAWTVNERQSALRLLDVGCDNLITSDPALMREVVDWYAGLGDTERMLLRLRRWMRQ